MLRLYPHGHVSAKAVGNVYSVHITLPSLRKILMDRRSFLQATSAITGGLITKQRATAGQFTEKIKKAVKLHMVTGSASVEDKFRLLKELGFDGVETRAKLDAADKALVQSYAAASEKIGLPIHGLIHSSNPDLIGAIDQAKFLGASSVLHVVRYDQTDQLHAKLQRNSSDHS